jgi:hippurate hydrolase
MRFSLLLCLAVLASCPAQAAPDFAPAVKEDYDRQLAALFDWFHRTSPKKSAAPAWSA